MSADNYYWCPKCNPDLSINDELDDDIEKSLKSYEDIYVDKGVFHADLYMTCVNCKFEFKRNLKIDLIKPEPENT